MESLAIPDSRINSSSELNVNTPAKNGRLNFIAGSSWCASTNDSNPYLQIDLQTLHIICAVSTQGNSHGDQWVETYNLQTSVDGITWTDYEEFGQVKVKHILLLFFFRGKSKRSRQIEKTTLVSSLKNNWSFISH